MAISLLRPLLLACTWASASLAAAAVGLTTLPGLDDDGPVTVFHPTEAAATTLQRGPFTLRAAADAAPARGNGRLVVLSHGSGGSPWPQSELAAALVNAGFVVAMPDHRGDNWQSTADAGPVAWRRRPQEVSRAIDAVLRDPRFAPLLDAQRVGVFGFSAGGHTALSLAGGRWSTQRMRRHCAAHLDDDFAACTGGFLLDGGWADGIKRLVARLLIPMHVADDETPQAHRDERIAAVVAAAPWAADFDPTSLATPPVPLALIEAPLDRWLLPRFHSGAVLRACTRCETIAAPADAGHGALLGPLPPALPGWLRALLDDPPGFDRAALPAMHRRIADFFVRRLGTTSSPTPGS